LFSNLVKYIFSKQSGDVFFSNFKSCDDFFFKHTFMRRRWLFESLHWTYFTSTSQATG